MVRISAAVVFMIAPLTLAYVVLVQRAMDVRVILRMGTRYVMAKAFILVLQFVLIPSPYGGFFSSISQKAAGALRLARRAGGFCPGARPRLRRAKEGAAWLDRKFFREAYDAEVVLNELSDEVRRFTETAPLLETVARRVAETLHINQVAMLLRRGENFQLQQAIGVTVDGAVTLPAQASAVRYLTSTNEPARLYREDPDAWYLMAGTSGASRARHGQCRTVTAPARDETASWA